MGVNRENPIGEIRQSRTAKSKILQRNKTNVYLKTDNSMKTVWFLV